MDKNTWAKQHGFNEDDMKQIELALSISNGRITEIMNEPLKYQDIKIKMNKC